MAPFSTKKPPKKLTLFLLSKETYIVGTHKNCLSEVLLMGTHNACFCGEIRKMLCRYSCYLELCRLPYVLGLTGSE